MHLPQLYPSIIQIQANWQQINQYPQPSTQSHAALYHKNQGDINLLNNNIKSAAESYVNSMLE